MSITVYGCVNFSSGTAVITFENLETCLEQSSCIIFTGVHAGQIALTLSGADDEDCNDTFYGCWNPTTSKFQIEIPEDCCVCNVDDIPSVITVIFSNMGYKSGYGCPSCCIPDMMIYHLIKEVEPLCWRYIFGQESPYIYNEITYYPTLSQIYWSTNWEDGTCPGNSGNLAACIIFLKTGSLCQKHFILDGTEASCGAAGSEACIVFTSNDITPWIFGHNYIVSEIVTEHIEGDNCYGDYQCILAHTSSLTNRPGNGIDWETYWILM